MRRFAGTVLFAVFLSYIQAFGGELKIAVVDFQRMFMSYLKREDLQKDLDARKEKMNKELASIEKELKAKRSDLEVLKPGTKEYRELQAKVIELETLLEVTRRNFQAQLEQEQRRHMQNLLNDLDRELQKYAKEKGIDLIISRYIADPRLARPLFIALYSRPDLDVTDELIQRVNDAYRKQKEKKNITR